MTGFSPEEKTVFPRNLRRLAPSEAESYPLKNAKSHFKNLETPTKMERVAGIQTGGSERAFDVYMKARFLGEQHPGHG